MIKIMVLMFVMFFTSCNSCEKKQDQLVSVIVLFRHGDKMPKSEYFDVYPNNPWMNPKLWNYTDLGSVTQKGKQNVYDRGKWLRERYAKFLPEKYSQKSVHVQASDSDRALMSAQLLTAGLFPPKGTDVWNDKLSWQPIPIHTIPEEEDLIIVQKSHCPKFEKLLQEQLTQETHKFDDLKYLKEYTGKEIETLEHVYKLYKLLKIVEENGMVLPNWAVQAMPLLQKKTDIFSKSFSMTPQMRRFKAGPFFHKVFEHYDAVLKNATQTPKMLLLAGHSRTLANVLMALDTYIEQPPYTSTLIFELKKNCNGSPIVDVYYQSAIGTPTEVVKTMLYQDFKDKMKPITVDVETWSKECRTSRVSFIF